jgi:drug/metabolite transporter (DMT)-like permease
MNSKTIGLLALGLATFATAPIVVRLGGQGADPIAITTVRTVLASLVLLPIWWWHKEGRKSTPESAKHTWLWSLLAGLFLSSHFALWVMSLGYTSVASASVLVTSHPVLLILIESALMGVVFRRLTWIGVVIAFAGSVMLALTDQSATATYSNPMWGNALAFTAALMFVGYILISQKIRRHHTWLDYVTRVYLTTALATVALFMLMGKASDAFTPGVLFSGILLALGAQLIGHGALNYAVKSISPTLLSTLILAEPVFATALAMLIFAEIPSGLASVAMTLTLLGIIISWWGRRNDVS